ncbi:MAG: hypothetical protein K2O45_08415 [Oscillospiraceae bacterium]|nr:hypothetical protein [Oscillospiraceae bacterium]
MGIYFGLSLFYPFFAGKAREKRTQISEMGKTLKPSPRKAVAIGQIEEQPPALPEYFQETHNFKAAFCLDGPKAENRLQRNISSTACLFYDTL